MQFLKNVNIKKKMELDILAWRQCRRQGERPTGVQEQDGRERDPEEPEPVHGRLPEQEGHHRQARERVDLRHPRRRRKQVGSRVRCRNHVLQDGQGLKYFPFDCFIKKSSLKHLKYLQLKYNLLTAVVV